MGCCRLLLMACMNYFSVLVPKIQSIIQSIRLIFDRLFGMYGCNHICVQGKTELAPLVVTDVNESYNLHCKGTTCIAFTHPKGIFLVVDCSSNEMQIHRNLMATMAGPVNYGDQVLQFLREISHDFEHPGSRDQMPVRIAAHVISIRMTQTRDQLKPDDDKPEFIVAGYDGKTPRIYRVAMDGITGGPAIKRDVIVSIGCGGSRAGMSSPCTCNPKFNDEEANIGIGGTASIFHITPEGCRKLAHHEAMQVMMAAGI